MSDSINHECGVAMVRLLKPLEFYQLKYGSWRYGLEKMYLLMEKQHNRGQDGAGIVCLKSDPPPGKKYISRERAIGSGAINTVFQEIYKQIDKLTDKDPDRLNNIPWVRDNVPFAGEVYLGHLRYGTFGKNKKNYVHPVMRENNWRTRNLILAGNFNLTNVDEIFNKLCELGQHPKDFSDTVTILENIGHFLDDSVQKLFDEFKKKGFVNKDISRLIGEQLPVEQILKLSSKRWDGGYVIAGIVGHGDSFVIRDPSGIRPAYYYKDDEIVVVASERPVIQTVMNVDMEDVKELTPGSGLIMKKNGEVREAVIREPHERKACSFERIYFSRGSDFEIYKERKKLGELIVPSILKAVNYDMNNTVFSFIPNTAEIAFYGMTRGLEKYMTEQKINRIRAAGNDISDELLREVLETRPRIEKTTLKDIKLRTFISADKGRDDLVAHVYDISYGTIRKGQDNLVVIDDSIVRGTTLRKSILRILDRLGPKSIVVASSSPQIRYPDCYGIDMAKLVDFIAFKAAIALLRESGRETVINQVYKKAKAEEFFPKEMVTNHVKDIYESFTDEQISNKIADLLTENNSIHAKVTVVYQTVDDLHLACPKNLGDWYFTGNYPTPGGNKVANKSFINFIEGRNERAY